MLVLIDNYDSFTFNLAHYLSELGEDVRVLRNDAIDVAALEAMGPRRVVISPGPGRPEQSGITMAVIARFAGRIPILGICLGMQAIGLQYGAALVHAPEVVHGRTSMISHCGAGLFHGLPSPLQVARYHSLALEPASIREPLEVTARTDDGIIMGLRHSTLPVAGVQFHPEAILTHHGHDLLRNWLQSN